MRNRKAIYIYRLIFYILFSFFWLFIGLYQFRSLCQQYLTTENQGITDWLPILATISVATGWVGGYLTTLARTWKTRLIALIAGIGSWILLITIVAISFGFDISQTPAESPGLDVGFGLFLFIFAGYHLGAFKQSAQTHQGDTDSQIE